MRGKKKKKDSQVEQETETCDLQQGLQEKLKSAGRVISGREHPAVPVVNNPGEKELKIDANKQPELKVCFLGWEQIANSHFISYNYISSLSFSLSLTQVCSLRQAVQFSV